VTIVSGLPRSGLLLSTRYTSISIIYFSFSAQEIILVHSSDHCVKHKSNFTMSNSPQKGEAVDGVIEKSRDSKSESDTEQPADVEVARPPSASPLRTKKALLAWLLLCYSVWHFSASYMSADNLLDRTCCRSRVSLHSRCCSIISKPPWSQTREHC
jgi:hypothetical protein